MKLGIFLWAAVLATAQDFTQRGFLDTTAILYPQAAANDSGPAVGEALLRYEAFYKLTPELRLAGGIDARADTHRETEREPGLSWWDRERQRPALDVRRLSLAYSRGHLTVEVGKQFIRWGRTDLLTPEDRFAPRDYLNVVDNDFLAVTAARLTYGDQANSIDLVFSPRLTPSRVPLLNQRWSGVPPGIPIHELTPELPGGPQFGARWNHIGRIAEGALAFYSGYDHEPLVRSNLADVQRYYPQMRMYGGDIAIPLSWVTFQAEAAYYTSASRQNDQYVLYVAQLQRQTGEWFFAAGYAGQTVTEHRGPMGFSFERGLARAFTAHGGYTIDTNRSVSFEGAAKQNGRGVWLQASYTQAFGQHWKVIIGFAWIRGSETDFIGRYHLNSHGILDLRYSF